MSRRSRWQIEAPECKMECTHAVEFRHDRRPLRRPGRRSSAGGDRRRRPYRTARCRRRRPTAATPIPAPATANWLYFPSMPRGAAQFPGGIERAAASARMRLSPASKLLARSPTLRKAGTRSPPSRSTAMLHPCADDAYRQPLSGSGFWNPERCAIRYGSPGRGPNPAGGCRCFVPAS